VSFEKFIGMLNEIRTNTSIKHPGLYLASFQLEHATFPYFSLILSSPTVEVALQIARRFRYVYSEVAYWHMEIEDNFCTIQRHTFIPVEVDDREHCLYTIAKVFLLLKTLLGGNANVERVCLIQPESEHKHELEMFFKCPISYTQDFDGFIITEKNLYRYQSNFDAKKYHQLLEELSHHKVVFPENQKFSSFVKGFILQTLSTGHCSLEHIANQIGMHPKAIQRRLLKENFTYKSAITDVRMSVAKRLLVQQDVSLIQISAMLGYSEPSAFSRAFQVVNHCSPREWRKRHL
jgi:AraC-like DNA-binding protein